MTSSACLSSRGNNAFNTNAARENINKHLQNSKPATKGGRFVEDEQVVTRDGLLADVESLDQDNYGTADNDCTRFQHQPSINQAPSTDSTRARLHTASHERKPSDQSGRSAWSQSKQPEQTASTGLSAWQNFTQPMSDNGTGIPFPDSHQLANMASTGNGKATSSGTKTGSVPGQDTSSRPSYASLLASEEKPVKQVHGQAGDRGFPPHKRGLHYESSLSTVPSIKTKSLASGPASANAFSQPGASKPIAPGSLATTPLVPRTRLMQPEYDEMQEYVSPPTQPAMNAGKVSRSAKFDSEYPCPYEDCDRGFIKASHLKRHKKTEHFYCSKCDVDCEDDVALINHRIEATLADTGKHVACLEPMCGLDFGCEAGRERHMRHAHREVQEIHCPGCHLVFERGASLIAHVASNKCKDPTGLVSQAVLSKGRVDAALELEKLESQGKEMRMAMSDDQSMDLSSLTGGGISISQSLLDRDDDIYAMKEISTDADDTTSLAFSTRSSSNGIVTLTVDGNGSSHAPDLKTQVAQGKQPEGQVIQGLGELKVDEGKSTPTWNKKLFPDAKPTPVVHGWTPPRPTRLPPRGKHSKIPNYLTGAELLRKQWEHYRFERDPNGGFKCPFSKCSNTYISEVQLKDHLISGSHQGTNHRCVKCCKSFKTPAALIAHMESSSERCNVRESAQYGHLLHVISGGFLDIDGGQERLDDGSVKMRAPTLKELQEQEARREEASLIRERELADEW